MTAENKQPDATDDAQHLNLLSTFHFVVAGLAALFALFPLIHVTIGWFLLHAPPSKQGSPPPEFIGWLFMIFGGMLFIAGETMAALIVAAGISLRRRVRYGFVFVLACIQCMFFPFGTVLGVFTIIVLSRPSVKQMFGISPPIPPPSI